MIRKLMAIAGLSMLGALAVPVAAQAYTAPDQGDLRLLIDPDAIRVGETVVPIRAENLMPGRDARLTIASAGVTGPHIPLTVVESAKNVGGESRSSAATTTTDDGAYTVSTVFPTAAVYKITSEGIDRNGEQSVVTFNLSVGPLRGGAGTLSTIGYTPLIAGSALALLGAGFFILERHRRKQGDEALPAHAA